MDIKNKLASYLANSSNVIEMSNYSNYNLTVGIIFVTRVEEELVGRRTSNELESDARRATRRSFFRRKKHQRSNSKELASFSNINSGWYSSDSGTLHDDSLVIASYQRVIRLNCMYNFNCIINNVLYINHVYSS